MNHSRGSLWAKCDFHVHTPYSALSHNLGDDFDEYVKALFKKAIEKRVGIIGITDYFTIDGYKRIKNEYLADETKLKQLFTPEEITKIKSILLLPNVEFRLNKIIQIIKKDTTGKEVKRESGRVNFHVLFSELLTIKQIEEDFLHNIDFLYEADPNEPDKVKKLKVDNLTTLGKRLKNEQPDILGSDLQVGMTHAVVNDEQIVKLLTTNNDFKNKYLFVTPSDEDLSEIQWKSQDSLTRKIIISRSHALFSSNPNTISFALGEKASSPEDFIKEFKTLKPCIWGSDSRDYDKLFEPAQSRYCWVKADPTFEGVRQILHEPKDRVYIGEYPELGTRIREFPGNYIDTLTISSVPGYDGRKGLWFQDFKLQFGFELIAIIGNKGKGKSAIADILGLLGNSRIDKKDFSFLRSDKFCQKGYAENFKATLKWFDKQENTRILNETIDTSSIEKIKYIPQSYLEKLCNSEDSGFKEEINKVVFSRLDDSDKLGKTSFAELEQYQTELINQTIAELKIKLDQVNRSIEYLHSKATPEFKKSIENNIGEKKKELEIHQKELDAIPPVPNPELDPSASVEQRQKADTIGQLNTQISTLENSIQSNTQALNQAKIALSDLQSFEKEVTTTVEKFTEWKNSRKEKYEKYTLNIDNIISLTHDLSSIQSLIKIENQKVNSLSSILSIDSIKNAAGVEQSLIVQLKEINSRKYSIELELAKPFKDYQEYQRKIKEGEVRKNGIIGNGDAENTLLFFEKELDYLKNKLSTEINEKIEERSKLVLNIYDQKKQIQEVYNKMKVAISGTLSEFSQEQNISIETSFKVNRTFYLKFFDYVNRYGHFYQEADDALRKLVDKYNFDETEQLKAFFSELDELDIRFKDGRKLEFNNYIGSLEFLNPEYDLRLNNISINQLSPGEKGGLLLVFYLILDKDNKPLIIDQPEDNLDNQSIAEILVPYIKNAKKKRQIIMITHNPNLAIVADAEQVIYMNIDKEHNYKVSCDSGGIEKLSINNHIVNILEGKMKAFNNRRVKYRKQ
jgi:predicted ATPase